MTDDLHKADVLICGAGIAGIATAYHLARHHHLRDVLLVDDRSPLSLTSDKSSEGYRNWWPGPGDAMVRLMDRSIDLLEQWADRSGNRFHLNRRGYVYLTADPERARMLRQEAAEIAALGAGPLRIDDNYEMARSGAHDGADFVGDPAAIHSAYPFLTGDIVAMLHARRCGWLSAQQLGMYLWDEARAAGARLFRGRVTGLAISGSRIERVRVKTAERECEIAAGAFVNAAGPFLAQVAAMMGIDLPVYNEPHGKIAFEDTDGIIDRRSPLMIWNDPIDLPWSEDERAELASDASASWLLDTLPSGLHFRPEGSPGSQTILALWPYHISEVREPVWPLAFDPEFVEIVLRGLTRMIPGLSRYLQRLSPPRIDGGYYCKTRENRPLISRLPIEGTYVIGALSGFGIMAAPAAAELLSAIIAGSELPAYAPAFALERYEDPGYQSLLAEWSPLAGQL